MQYIPEPIITSTPTYIHGPKYHHIAEDDDVHRKRDKSLYFLMVKKFFAVERTATCTQTQTQPTTTTTTTTTTNEREKKKLNRIQHIMCYDQNETKPKKKSRPIQKYTKRQICIFQPNNNNDDHDDQSVLVQ